MPATYTVKQVSKLLGYSTNSIYTFLKEKRLKGVRIGKGRFRIPQSQINTFLQVDRGVAVPAVSQKPLHAESYADTFEDFSQIERVEVPSLFDWFIGVSAILLGASWMLFPRSYLEFPVQMYILIIPMLRGVLVASGIGLLLSDIVGSGAKIWGLVFQGVLSVAFACISGASFWYGSSQNGLLFGFIALLLLGLFFFRKQSVLLFLVQVFSSAITVLYFQMLPMNQSVLFYGIMSMIVLSMGVGIYGLLKKQTALLHLSLIPACSSLLYSSVKASESGMWSITLFLVFSAVLSVFIPVWNSLSFTNMRDRSFVFGVIGSVLCVFVFTAGGVRLIQNATITQYTKGLNDKIILSKLYVEKSFGLAEESIRVLSKNNSLVDSLEKKSYSTLIDLSKSVVSGNTSIRHITIVGTDGEVKSSYPYVSGSPSSLSTLPSISQALATKKLNILQEPTLNNVGNNKQIVISAPILNSKSIAVGVVLATIDIDAIVSGVRQITSESQQQIVRIADSSGNILTAGPDEVAGFITKSDPISIALTGTKGIVTGYSVTGEQVIAAVDQTGTAIPLALSVETPYSVLLQMKETSPLIVLFLLIMSSGSIVLFFISHRKRRIPDKNSISRPAFERERNTS